MTKSDAAAKPVLFEVRRRLKLWVVMRDDVYCGSYPDEVMAEDAAKMHIQAIIKGGGKAEMVKA